MLNSSSSVSTSSQETSCGREGLSPTNESTASDAVEMRIAAIVRFMTWNNQTLLGLLYSFFSVNLKKCCIPHIVE